MTNTKTQFYEIRLKKKVGRYDTKSTYLAFKQNGKYVIFDLSNKNVNQQESVDLNDIASIKEINFEPKGIF